MRSLVDRPALLLGLGAILAIVAFQLWISPSNPPGYHRDEAALSLNAYTLSQGLRDEDGARLPLFFRSFDDYKSPVYPYLLAGVFEVTGPSQSVARGLSAVLVLAAILLLGLLAYRLTRSYVVATAVVVLGGLTPWLFELGRMAIEATTQPLLVVLLLLWLERVARLRAYGVPQGVPAGVLIGLVTYSYTGSRLLGPLFAARSRRVRRDGVAGDSCSRPGSTFAVTLVPIGLYAIRHPGNLTARYEATTIARDGLSGPRVVLQAIGNWFRDINPWHWATAGDPAPYIHNGGYGALFAAPLPCSRSPAPPSSSRVQRSDLWWRYVLVATLLVPIPAALTVDRYNAIRLATLPVFALVLAVPALAALFVRGARRRGRRACESPCSPSRSPCSTPSSSTATARADRPVLVLFEAGVEPLLREPLESGVPIYVDFDDRGAQAMARWRAAVAGVPPDRIVILPDGGVPPPGSLVFLRFQDCDFECADVASWEDYRLVRAVG